MRPTRLPTLSLALASALAWAAALPASAAPLSFHEQSLDLPGAPAAVVSTDLDGDGLRDLAVVVVYTNWDQIGVEEWTEMDQVEGLVEVLTIVPVLLDRREVRAYLGQPGGGFAAAGEPLPLPLSILSLEPGPPGAPALALTDDGVSVLRFDRADGGGLRFEPVIESPPVLASSGAFLAGLDLVADVTGDGVADLLLPTAAGLAVHRGTGDGIEATPVSVVALPGVSAEDDLLGSRVVEYPLPRVVDLDGDGRPDLLFRTPGVVFGPPGSATGDRHAARNLGNGRFDAPTVLETESRPGDDFDLTYVGPLRPGAPAGVVYVESLGEEDAGMREEMRQAREPDQRLHFRALRVGGDGDERPLAISAGIDDRPPKPVKGYVPEDWPAGRGDDDDGDFQLPGGFQDLNGDGRTDLVTVTNDISLMKAMAILATRRLTLDLAFHPWCQGGDGGFHRAPGEPLESRLTIDLNDIELRRRSLFSGDFDGDGRADFLQLGRPKKIGIHGGRADCSYPERPDATLTLRDPIRDLALVDARDLNGDGRADLAVTHPRPVDDRGVTPPVRLDLYLSRPDAAAAGGAR